MEDLIDDIEIRFKLEKKLGHGAITKIARHVSYTRSYCSAVIKGKRKNNKILLHIANLIGCSVHGVCPDGSMEYNQARDKKESI